MDMPMAASSVTMSWMEIRRASVVSVVLAPMAKKLKSSMYERTVVGYISKGERDGLVAKAVKAGEE